ncbi:histidine phosphatase family protein [Mediterraneibacter catenae]|uniref:Histidine phosphatase family protein n=1 Tax=Mediterraneibacter catenae TaxID=2594882 RepID=A0A5M9HZ29_9FIRM|nr:histidine phosphatase family protein [Mediterraneibacter catenae]KAA8500581.1 histidine phosphatase family protein [Mediterraneibacter catenae]
MRVVFIRHLCTPGNEKRQYIGRTDEDLSERVAEEFRQRQEKSTGGLYPSVQYIITSPLKRCIQTAGLIYPGMEIVTEPMLRECDFGEYEQKTYEDLKNEPEYIRWLESGGMTAFPSGEDQTSFRRRCVDGVKRWIDRLLEDGADNAAFVVHGGTIMAVLSELAEDKHEFYHWQVENGGGYVAEVSGEEWRNSRKVLRVTQRI